MWVHVASDGTEDVVCFTRKVGETEPRSEERLGALVKTNEIGCEGLQYFEWLCEVHCQEVSARLGVKQESI